MHGLRKASSASCRTCQGIFLAAYSTTDLSDSNLKVLSIYGSNDGVLSMEKYEENKSNLPGDFTEVVIDGGCHASIEKINCNH